MRRAILRALLPAAVLAVLLVHVGPRPFVRGVTAVSPVDAGAALAITALATVCAAWRWRVVAAGLGDRIPWGRAIAWYYRSQFLNSVLPFGVAGDLHRGLALRGMAREAETPRLRGLRGVAWERFSGQLVTVVVATGVVLALGPAPLRREGLVALGIALVVLLVVAVLVRIGPHALRRSIAGDLRAMFPGGATAGSVVLASALATVAHVAVFLIAAHAALPWATAVALAPVGMVVLLGASIPLNLAGWGPREGVAAWAFATVGLGAATGVQVAATYGVLALVATLPGLVPLVRAPRIGVHDA